MIIWAKKERFVLEMADGTKVRDLDALKEHFDVESVEKYFHDGKLLIWLEDRYYDDEADSVRAINGNDAYLAAKLCKIFDVETPEDIERRIERLNRLKNYTNDEKILVNVDKVAFDQEDLADLLDEGIDEIYLCNNKFSIPLRVKNKVYIGVGKSIAGIRSDKPVDFDALNIGFKNISFNPEYAKLIPDKNPPKILGNTAEVTTTIINRAGIHDKLASAFVKKACSFKSDIKISAKGKTVDAKSLMMLMTIGLAPNLEVTILAKGDDSQKAVTELKNFIDSGFSE